MYTYISETLTLQYILLKQCFHLSVSYDVDCQTDALLIDDDLEEDDSDLDSEEYEDSFCAVQEMLRSLRLLNLEPMFIENGIRVRVHYR